MIFLGQPRRQAIPLHAENGSSPPWAAVQVGSTEWISRKMIYVVRPWTTASSPDFSKSSARKYKSETQNLDEARSDQIRESPHVAS